MVRGFLRVFSAVVMLSLATHAYAAPVVHAIRFTVETGSVFTSTLLNGEPVTQQRSAVGDVYFGFFSVDSEVLQSDGVGKPGQVGFFIIQMQDNIWAYNFPGNNSFEGFRGPIPGDPHCMEWASCLGAPSPGFSVTNGRITGLTGGVFGWSDASFVDFGLPAGGIPDTSFSAITEYGPVYEEGDSWTYLQGQGHLEVFRVEEPDTILLLLAGLCVIAVGCGSRRAQV